MKRMSVLIPEEVARQVALQAQRRGVSPSVVLREAIAAYVERTPEKRGLLRLAGAFDSGTTDTSERVDEVLHELASDMAERNGL